MKRIENYFFLASNRLKLYYNNLLQKLDQISGFYYNIKLLHQNPRWLIYKHIIKLLISRLHFLYFYHFLQLFFSKLQLFLQLQAQVLHPLLLLLQKYLFFYFYFFSVPILFPNNIIL